MAHAGTTNGINQPVATGSGRQAGLWIALITGAVIVAIALAFVVTQGTGSRSVISAQRAPAIVVAPGAVTAPTFGPDWYARHMPATVAAPTFGPDWYARHMPATVTTDAAAGTASANADRNRHHRPRTPGQRLHR